MEGHFSPMTLGLRNVKFFSQKPSCRIPFIPHRVELHCMHFLNWSLTRGTGLPLHQSGPFLDLGSRVPWGTWLCRWRIPEQNEVYVLKEGDQTQCSNSVSAIPYQFSSVAQSCLTLCDPMNFSTPGLPAYHKLPEFTQTHAHRVGDAIQPSPPLSSPSPPAPNPSQHQGLFHGVNSLHEVAKVLEFQLQHQSFQWTPSTHLLQDGLVGSPCSPRDSQESSPTPQFKSINFFG